MVLISIFGLRLKCFPVFIGHVHFLFGEIVYSFTLPTFLLTLFLFVLIFYLRNIGYYVVAGFFYGLSFIFCLVYNAFEIQKFELYQHLHHWFLSILLCLRVSLSMVGEGRDNYIYFFLFPPPPSGFYFYIKSVDL